MNKKQKNPQILAINDGRKGHFNQILGVLHYLPFAYKVIDLKASKIGKLPNELVIYNAIGISNENKNTVSTMAKNKDFPKIILSAGRKSFAFARYVKKQALKHGFKTIVCQFMFPGFKSKDADLVFVSDEKYLKDKHKNLIYKELAAGNVNENTLQESTEKLKHFLQQNNFNQPYATLMLGGNHKNKVVYSKLDAIKMVQNLAKVLKNQTLLVSTSRRTPLEFSQTFYQECQKHIKSFYFYDFANNNLNFNPYYGFFNLASNIIITYDSVSMISEACSLGKTTPIWIYDDFMVKYDRFDLYKKLQTKGYVANFANIENGFFNKSVIVPNYTKQIAEEILKKYNKIFL